MSSRSRVEFGEREYIREAPRRPPADFDEVDIRVRDREDRLPHFMREENRRAEPGQLVLRQREVETIERPRPRSPSPVRVRERIVQRTRSVSPPPRRLDEEVRFRRVVREQSRGPTERIRFVPQRSRSPSPEVQERIRIVEREKERAPSPAPPPRPPTPKVIKGPTIEREVITHYRDIDHGEYPQPWPFPALPSNTLQGWWSLALLRPLPRVAMFVTLRLTFTRLAAKRRSTSTGELNPHLAAGRLPENGRCGAQSRPLTTR
jgi:hypothetical protein